MAPEIDLRLLFQVKKQKLHYAAVSSLYHALKNYLNSIETSRTNIHLTHLNTFKDYVLAEVGKNHQLSSKSFDIFKWYNLAFSHSRTGSLAIGKDYIIAIADINESIKASNDIAKGIVAKAFSYHEHQTRIIKSLMSIGVSITRMPRNDFYEIEGEILLMIEKVNREFCFLDSEGKIHKRYYN